MGETMIIFYRNATEKEQANKLADKYIPYPTRILTTSKERVLMDGENLRTIRVKEFRNESSALGLRADFVFIPKDADLYTSCFNTLIGITRGNHGAIMFYN